MYIMEGGGGYSNGRDEQFLEYLNAERDLSLDNVLVRLEDYKNQNL
jgi:hypothetical protein